MKNSVVVDMFLGDCGKSRIVDYLSKDARICVRWNGSQNAGHTIYHNDSKYVFHMVPAGMLNGNVGVITSGVSIDPFKLVAEINEMRDRGIDITPSTLKISHACHIITELHKMIDAFNEERLGDKKIGTTKSGVSPCVVDKYARRGLRMLDLVNGQIKEAFGDNLNKDVFSLQASKYGINKSYEQFVDALLTAGSILKPFVCDTSAYLQEHVSHGGVVFEGAQSTLLDVDHGMYPFVTAGSCVSGYAAVSGGFGPQYLHNVVGVAKAFISRVGAGPLPTRMADNNGVECEDGFREYAGEFGATTGRPRKLGWFDMPMLKYSARLNGVTTLAITRMDTLQYFNEVLLCDHYVLDGKILDTMPIDHSSLFKAKPHFISFKGWKNIEVATKTSEIPDEAKRYLGYIERHAEVEIGFISTGKNRDQMIVV